MLNQLSHRYAVNKLQEVIFCRNPVDDGPPVPLPGAKCSTALYWCSNSYENDSTEISHASFMGSFIKCSDDENNKHKEKMHCLPVEKENHLVFTKSVDSNFRAFWLAPVTRNILGYSLFCERREKWGVVSRKFRKKKLKKHFVIHLIW